MKNIQKRINLKKPGIDPCLWLFMIYFLVFILLYQLSPTILGAITFGWYLSLVIEAPARKLSRIKFISYKAAVIISSVVMLAIFVFGFYQIIPIVVEQGKTLFPMIKETFTGLNLPFFADNSAIELKVLEWINKLTGEIVGKFTQAGVAVINYIIQNIPDAMIGIILFIITASCFTALMPGLKKNLWRFFPVSGREKAISFVKENYNSIRFFIGGQILIACVIGLIVGLGMFICGIPYFFFLGFLSGITNFVPYLGVLIAAIPAVFLGFTNSGIWGIVKVAAVLILANQLEVWFLSPRIQGARMELNWFVIIVGILLCGTLFGLIGVLLAVPIMVFFKKYWVEYIQKAFEDM